MDCNNNNGDDSYNVSDNNKNVVTIQQSQEEEVIDIEKVFVLIEKGKQHELDKKFWAAAESFKEACEKLTDLAQNQEEENDKEEISNEEKTKIIELYRYQSQEYFHRARDCFIEAIKTENNDDLEFRKQQQEKEQQQQSNINNFTDNNHNTENGHVHNNDDENEKKIDEADKIDCDGEKENCKTTYDESIWQQHCFSLSLEEAKRRLQIFTHLFSKEIPVVNQLSSAPVSTAQEDGKENAGEDQVEEKKNQLSLEERLMQLNASLPKGLKTDKERLQDINSGLSRLGISSTYHYKKPGSSDIQPTSYANNSVFALEVPKSEEDQIEDIIAQAKDEVELDKVLMGKPATAGVEEGGLGANHDTPSSVFAVKQNVPTQEQVDQLIALTKDEVAFEKQKNSRKKNKNNSTSSMDGDDSYNNSDSDNSSVITKSSATTASSNIDDGSNPYYDNPYYDKPYYEEAHKQQREDHHKIEDVPDSSKMEKDINDDYKNIREQITETQAKLAELVALIDTTQATSAPTVTTTETENGEDSNDQVACYGRKLLLDARNQLNDALEHWPSSSSSS